MNNMQLEHYQKHFIFFSNLSTDVTWLKYNGWYFLLVKTTEWMSSFFPEFWKSKSKKNTMFTFQDPLRISNLPARSYFSFNLYKDNLVYSCLKQVCYSRFLVGFKSTCLLEFWSRSLYQCFISTKCVNFSFIFRYTKQFTWKLLPKVESIFALFQ